MLGQVPPDRVSALPWQLACECYSRVPSLGAGFSQGLKHTESWEKELHNLLASLHSLLGALYEGAEAGGPGLVVSRMHWRLGSRGWEGSPDRWSRWFPGKMVGTYRVTYHKLRRDWRET